MKLNREEVLTREVLDWQGLHLLHFQSSSCSQKTRLVLAAKGLTWQSHHIDLGKKENYTDWYLGINPRGLVPCLVQDGEVHIESNDIIDYLEKSYPEPALIPKGKESVVHEWLVKEEDLHMDLRNLNYRLIYMQQGKPAKSADVLEKYRHHPGKIAGEEDQEKQKQLAYWDKVNTSGISDEDIRGSVARFYQAFSSIDQILENQSKILGDSLSLVDIAWFVYVSKLKFIDYPFASQHSNIERWYLELAVIPGFLKEVAPSDWVSELMVDRRKELETSKSRLVDIVDFDTL